MRAKKPTKKKRTQTSPKGRRITLYAPLGFREHVKAAADRLGLSANSLMLRCVELGIELGPAKLEKALYLERLTGELAEELPPMAENRTCPSSSTDSSESPAES